MDIDRINFCLFDNFFLFCYVSNHFSYFYIFTIWNKSNHACKCSEMVWFCSVPIIFAFCSISIFIVLHSLLTNCPEGTLCRSKNHDCVFNITIFTSLHFFSTNFHANGWANKFPLYRQLKKHYHPTLVSNDAKQSH